MQYNMKMQNRQKSSGRDVLYKVDPQKLTIKLCYFTTAAEPVAEYTTNFECFSYERVTIKPEVPIQIKKLPASIEGMFYFATEEEAQDFIKKQIGL